ncbi:ankyrin repeat domain-containing protein [Wolbachia endosymbiont (group A) of Nomada goodeniana]|uniref:ankyrin repeat domain-containing protein n=1 Tax=Wolbachia endosymbiont (group A) of Nomada goodeniana TaxID=3066207 RepID=UPI00333EFC6F
MCEKLKRASSIGNQECVEAILNRFEDTESRDPAISSKLLHYAVEKGDYDLVNSLIKNDANVNIQDRNNKTALHYAVSSYGDIQNVNKMVMLLVESGAKIDTQDSDGKTALHYAAASNKDEIVRLLLKEGANEEIKDKSGKTFLDMVASGTKSFLLNVLHPGGLLHHAAKEGNIDRAKRLLAKGKDVNAKNSHRESPLSVAIQNNRLKIVKLFLEERAKIGKEEVNKAIGAGNLEVIELLVSKDAVITEKAIQYARGVYEKCEEDKKQAHSSVLTFLVDIHNEQLFKKAIEQGDLKKIKSYVDKGTVISGEIIQCARDACKICREDKKQAHLSVLTFLMKTSKDQFKEAIKLGNLERVKLFVEKGAVITEKIIQYVQNAYEKYKEGRVCISQYPDGMKAEERNRTEILNFLKDNVRSNSNLVNETATSSQVVNEEDNNQSENPGLESAGSKQPQENVDKGKNIMNNEEASIEEAIGNNYRRGKMSKNKKSIKQGLFIDVIYDVKRMKNFLESNDDKLVLKKALNQVNTELTKKENTRGLDLAKKNIRINQKKRLTEAKELLTEKISNIEMNAKTAASSVNDVSATTSSQAAPVSEDVSQDIRSEILVPSSSVSPDVGNVSTAENINDNMVASENSGQVNDVQSGDEQPDSPPLSPQSSASGDVEDTEASANAAVTIPKKVDSLVSDKDVTDGSDNEFVKVSPPPEDNTHSPQSIRVRDSFGYTPLKVAHERNITVKTRNAQNLQSAVLSSQQLASLNVIEIFNKHGREDFTPLKLTVQEFLNNGISEIQLPASNGCITFNLNVINEASPEELQNIVKVLTDLYKNGALNDRTRNAIGTGAQDDIDGHRLSEEDPIPTPTPAPTPNLTPNPIPTPTPEPTPQTTPALKPTLIPSVANNKSEQVNDTQTNGKLPNNPGNGSITAAQNTQKSKWPTVATWTLAVAGVVSGVAITVYLEMLAAGIAVGACCLVAAPVIYYCTPKSSVENSNVETVKTAELIAQ